MSTTPANKVQRQRLNLLSPLLIIGVGGLVYLNSFSGQFLFDDHQYIDDPVIHQLWPIWKVMFSPEVIARSLVSLSLALNYAISGKEVWSYHIFNVLIHLLAALTLYGIVRRSLLSERLRRHFAPAATGLALATALVWVVHPLETQAVTYVIQRAESMMGLFYLLTLYCAIRAAESSTPARWIAAAVAACLAGVGCKAVIVTAPLMVLLYDVVFLSGTVRNIIKKRWPLYAGLAATWICLALALMANHPPGVSAGFELKIVSPLEYLKSQFGVVTHYLQLAVWPSPLVLDYFWLPARGFKAVAPYAFLIGAIGAASFYGLWRRSPLGFLGAWFFIILLPTSSIVPVADLAVEHRMYLSLAAVIAFFIIGGYRAGEWRLAGRSATMRPQALRAGVALVTIIVAWFGSLTVRRNADYQSEIVMWADVVRKRPDNPRAHTNLGFYLIDRGEYDEALAQLNEAIRLNPGFVEAHLNAGKILADQGRSDEALEQFYQTLQLRPNAKRVHYNIGQVLANQQRWSDAIAQYQQEIALDPQFPDARLQWARVLEIQNHNAEAINQYREILSRWPDKTEPMLRLAALLIDGQTAELRNPREAIPLAERAVQITARQPDALDVLAAAYAADHRFNDAVATANEAMSRAAELKQDALRAQILSRLQKYEQGRTAN